MLDKFSVNVNKYLITCHTCCVFQGPQPVDTDLPDLAACLAELPGLVEQLARRLERMSETPQIGKQVVKIKFRDFSQTTVETAADSLDMDTFRRLCETGFQRGGKPVRLLGVGVRLPPPS